MNSNPSLQKHARDTHDVQHKRQASQTICPSCSSFLAKDSNHCAFCEELMSARQSESECDTDRNDQENLPSMNRSTNKKLNDNDLKKMYLKQRKQILRKKEAYLARENVGLQNRQAAAIQRSQNEQFISPTRQRSRSKEGPVERQKPKQFQSPFPSSPSRKKQVQEIKVYKQLDLPKEKDPDEAQIQIEKQQQAKILNEVNEKLKLIEIEAEEKLKLIDIEAEKQLKIIQENSFKESIIQAQKETSFEPKRREDNDLNNFIQSLAPYIIAKIQEDGNIVGQESQSLGHQIKIIKNLLVKFQLDYIDGDICNFPRLILNQQILRTEAGLQNYFIVPPIDAHQQFDESLVQPRYFSIVEPKIDPSKSFMEFEVTFNEAGLYFFQIEYKNRETGKFQYTQHQPISVQPQVNNKNLSELKMLSVVSKRMGKLNRWPLVLSEAISDGFNAINFSPFQELNAESSQSSNFSISNFNQVSDYFFENPKTLSKQQKEQKVKDQFKELQDQGIAVINDIVLDQASLDSKWLSKIPNATYNIENCPNLFAAWVLDQALQEFSQRFADDQIPELGFAPNIKSSVDITKLMLHLREQVIEPLQISEFFQINISQVIFEISKLFHTFAFKDGLHDTLQSENRNFEQLGWMNLDPFDILLNMAKGFGQGPNRFGVSIDITQAISFYILKNDNDRDKGKQQLGDDLIRFNQHQREKCQELLGDALEQIENQIRQVRIAQKILKITRNCPIVEKYFSQLYDGTIVALGGQLIDNKGAVGTDETVINGQHYLRRSIKIQSGNVILRYGNGPSECPLLWDHMLSYIQNIAAISDGIRVHNSKLVPEHVLHFMLSAARSKNPNLIVMAESSYNKLDQSVDTGSSLGLTYVIKNIQNFTTCSQIAKNMNDIQTDKTVECIHQDLQGNPYIYLSKSRPIQILFDSYHDNVSLVDRFGSQKIALPLMALNCSSPCATASTWGYDLLLEKHVDKFENDMLYGVKIPVEFDASQIFEQEFWIDFEGAKRVSVAGDFNGWRNDQLYLQRDENGIWCGTHKLYFKSAEDTIQYKFVIDGEKWVHNDILPQQTDPNGHQNNIVRAESFLTPPSSGLRPVRQILSDIHSECNSFNAKTFVDVHNEELLVTIRQFEQHDQYSSYVFIQKLNIGWSSEQQDQQRRNQGSLEIILPGLLDQVMFAGRLIKSVGEQEEPDNLFIMCNDGHQVGWQGLEEFCQVSKVDQNWGTEQRSKLSFYTMPEGMTCVLKVRLSDHQQVALTNLNQFMSETKMTEIFAKVPASGLNHLIYRCQSEEMTISDGNRSPYSLEDRNEFAFAGIASIMHIIKNKSSCDEEALHDFEALKKNMEQGDWLMDYTLKRLESYHETNYDMKLENLISFFRQAFSLLKQIPRRLKSQLEVKLYEAVYFAVKREIVTKRCTQVFMFQSQDLMTQQMVMAAYQFWGRVPSAQFQHHRDSLSHGSSFLTNFSPEYFRKRGRDTFIALRGMLLTTGMEAEARDCLIQFAKVMRHGLIPNLHGNGESARFDSRDTTWYFLQAIKDFVCLSEEGTSFLNSQVRLYFLDDDQDMHIDLKYSNENGKTLSIFELVLEILKRHAQGIKLGEDFDVSILCDLEETGFCFGGSKQRCCTWMDSTESENLVTPRDGAPIELVALQYSILSWLTELNSKGLLLESGISITRTVKKIIQKSESQISTTSDSIATGQGNEIFRYVTEESVISFQEWAIMIKNSFERCYWIPEHKAQDYNHDIFEEHVHRRGIYKDVYRSSDGYTDYQLRPNVCVAMSMAPSLFEPTHARICLDNLGKILLEKGSLGVKSLDPNDYNYKADQCGSNHHQGPEFIWPLGFFLKAKLLHSNYQSKEEATWDFFTKLQPIKSHLLTYSNKFEGLPDLTNSKGQLCPDAIKSNAMSIGTILDALRDLNNFKNES